MIGHLENLSKGPGAEQVGIVTPSTWLEYNPGLSTEAASGAHWVGCSVNKKEELGQLIAQELGC